VSMTEHTDTRPPTAVSWEHPDGVLTTYRVKIRDHDETYDFEWEAVDLRYALATLLIEHRIYLASADGIEITAVVPG
jgi:hypothetical protein